MKIAWDVRDNAATLRDNAKAALNLTTGSMPGVSMTMTGAIEDSLPAEAFAKAGMATMSQKFKDVGEQVYVQAEAVKASNREL